MIAPRALALLGAATAGVAAGWLVAIPASPGHAAVAAVDQQPFCRMAPPRQALRLPAGRMMWLAGESESGPCESVGENDWTRTPSRPVDLWVHADGPSGSGRYWTLTVGTGLKADVAPSRLTCFSTSTVGWRTLRRFGDGPLPWTADGDRDERGELIVWTSFPLSDSATAAEFGLMAWVYEMQGAGVLGLDLAQSRRMASRIAAAYRDTAGVDRDLAPLRRRAVESLAAFAGARCRIRPGPARR